MPAVPGLVDAAGFDNNNVGEDVMSHLQQRQRKAIEAASRAVEVRRPHIYDCPPTGAMEGQHAPPPRQYLHTKKAVRVYSLVDY